MKCPSCGKTLKKIGETRLICMKCRYINDQSAKPKGFNWK